MIDTHCHLNIEEFEMDYQQVIKDALAEGVNEMIVIGIDPISNKKAIELADTFNELYATVGIHPGVVDDYDIQSIEPLLKHEKVIAIGEIGLDLYWRQDNIEKQKEIFIKQIQLAIKHQLPIVIHTRNSFSEAYDCVKPYKGKIKGVFHCFSSHLEDAKKAVDLGFYIGIDGPVTFKNAKDIKEIATHIPLDKILIETDSPYLSPHPFRGKRNEPKRLSYIAQAIADLKGISKEEVVKITTLNAHELFHIGVKI
ncbi:TatD family hydrolase [Mycoplasmatota bacterium]|nr:TatD family hydrolase [Mycoplasmatota bacterium]